jgi:Zn-dependent protease/CBS domain-containing protein
MKWSWRIGRVMGIGIYMHITFLLVPLWVGLSQFAMRRSWFDLAEGVGFVLVLFSIVVLHELGHAATARRFGIRTRDITLLPIGGVARLERIPEDPKQELLVALAGPAVNACLAVVFLALAGASSRFSDLTNVSVVGGDLLLILVWVNVVLILFNLIPAFPMDGGRVLRALLAMRLSYVRATTLAARVGQVIAFCFAGFGLASMFFGYAGPFSNPLLVFVGLFVWVGAAQEAGMVQIKSALGGVPVHRLMITRFQTVSPRDPLAKAAGYLVAGWQHDFPVVEEGRLVGLLTRTALVDGLAQRGSEASVADIMLLRFPTIGPDEAAEKALLQLRSGESQTLLAARDGELFGVLTSENVGEYLLIRAALDRQPLAPAPAPRPSDNAVA